MFLNSFLFYKILYPSTPFKTLKTFLPNLHLNPINQLLMHQFLIPIKNDLPFDQDNHLITDFLSLLQIMSRQQADHFLTFLPIFQKILNFNFELRIYGRGRFVQNYNFRPIDQSHSNLQFFLISTRQFFCLDSRKNYQI